jgi:general secretion pathway protein J
VASDELRSLTLAFAQMDEDLLKSWPVNLLKLNEAYLRVAVGGERNAQSLHLIREVNRSELPTRVQRVVYEVRDRQLARGFSEYGRAEAGSGGSLGGNGVQTMVWQPVLSGVRSLTIRGWVDGRGWMDARNLASIEQARQQAVRAASSGAAATAGSALGGATGPVTGGSTTGGGAGSATSGAIGGARGGVPGAGSAGGQAAALAGQAAADRLAAAQAQFSITGIEVVVERVDGQRFLRVYSVKD